jgi:predicted TPR repeat methyltransferase
MEHHRGGRIGQAEAAYRALLDADPGNPNAMHWLGVLIYQAGRPEKALSLLEQAAAMRPKDAAFQHNLACAYVEARQYDDAIKSYNKAIAADPANAESVLGLGAAYLARRSPGDIDAALSAYAAANAAGLDSPDLRRQWAAAFFAANQFPQTIEQCGKAIELKSDDLDAYHLMALAQQKAGDAAAARATLKKSLEIDPNFARAVHGLAILEAQSGDLLAAEKLLRKSIELRSHFPPAHRALAQVLKALGRQHEALEAAAQAVRLTRPPGGVAANAPSFSGDFADDRQSAVPLAIAALQRRLAVSPKAEMAHFALASKQRLAPPPIVPAKSVVELFNRYADRFDDHLQGKLSYRVPEMIGEIVAALPRGKPPDVLDLGCGTGLCGPHLRPLAGTLDGVDLAPLMIEKARQRGVYDALETDDLVAALNRSARRYDLLVAADVFVYIGDLAPAFEAATIALRPGGAFIFSVEAGAGDRYTLQRNARFAHAKSYLDRLADIFGFAELSNARIVVRTEADQPVPGYLILLQMVG